LVIQDKAQRLNRRKPQDFSNVNMPFDTTKFNFTKIKQEEVLFRVRQFSCLSSKILKYLFLEVDWYELFGADIDILAIHWINTDNQYFRNLPILFSASLSKI